MAVLTWNHACVVGVRAMDNQHALLMDAANDLRLAWMRGSGHKKVGELMRLLMELARMHFRNEEQLMEQAGFPGLAAHCGEHQRLLRRFEEAARHAETGENVPLHAQLCAVSNALLAHFEGMDRDYGPWMNARGLD